MDENFFEMKVYGKYCIWINGYVSIQIDRVLCNFSRGLIYGNVFIYYMEKYILDYFFIYFKFSDISRGKMKFFRFLNIFVDYIDFLKILKDVWNQDVQGIVMYKIWRKF